MRKHIPSGVWHFHYKDDNGDWLTRSTGDRDKRGAMKWADQLSARLASGDAQGAKKVALIRTSMADAIDQWLEYQRAKAKRTTFRTYSSILEKFKTFCSTISLRFIGDITEEKILAFRAWAVANGNAKVTVTSAEQ